MAIAPLMPRSARNTLAPRQWRDRFNNVAAATPVRHEHSPTPLCACGHTDEQAAGTDRVRCKVWRCACGDHPPLAATFPAPETDSTAEDEEGFFADDDLPVHHLDEGPDGTQRGLCPHAGEPRNSLGGCPLGCEGAYEHYSNDGHRACADYALPAR